MSNEDDYQRLGLTELQAQVLTTLMELGGEASAPEIIELLGSKQKINRTSIYSVLNSLEQMGIVFTKGDGRGSTYALISTSPEILVNRLLEPQKSVAESFTRQLQEAKERQEGGTSYEMYYLDSKDKIINQLELLIEQSDQYLLIMATSTMLDRILNRIRKKHKNGLSKILIIPTWNPSKDLDMGQIIDDYRSFLPSNHVSDSMPILQRLLPIMQTYLKELPEDFQHLVGQINFIQALTPDEMILATFTSDDRVSSGFYSREPFISQMLHIIYLSLIDQFSSISSDLIDEILETKVGKIVNAVQNP